MAFEDSESLDDLIEDCEKESEALEESEALNIAEPAEESETAEPSQTIETTEEPQPEEAAKEPETAPPRAVNPPKDKVRVGKHGRPLKTDPYGNLIRKKKKDAPLRSEEPVNTVTPADIQKPQVSFMNSVANREPTTRAHWQGDKTEQAYDHAVLREEEKPDSEYTPKIRKMRDSTRAKETRQRHGGSTSMPYQKDSPVEPLHTAPAPRGKKRESSQDALERVPERFKEHVEEDAAPIEYLRQAPQTQIDFSETENVTGNDTDIDIRYPDEKRERSDIPPREKTFRDPADRAALKRDLVELKGSLAMRVVFLGVLTLMSSIVTILNFFPKLPIPAFLSSTRSPLGYLTVQIAFGVLAVLLSGKLVLNGYKKMLEMRPDCDSLAAMSLITALLSAISILPSPKMLSSGIVSCYISAALLAVWLNTVSKNLTAARALRNFRVLADGNPKYGIHYVEDEKRAEDLTRGCLGDYPVIATMRPVDNPEDFLKYTFSGDLGDKFCRKAVPIVFWLGAAFSVIMAIVRHATVGSAFCYGLSIFALCFSAASCVAIPLISNLPMASATKNFVRNSGVLLGYQSVDDFYDVNTVMIDAQVLFPKGTTTLESIQVIGEGRIEEALQYSASLTQHAGSILKDLFAGAILAEDTLLLPVENYTYDEGKGISGWIENKRVLLGTREMMIAHNVEGIPACSKEEALVGSGNEALYFAVSGTVTAMYVVRLEASRGTVHWLHELVHEEIFLLIRSNDALLSGRRISKMFGIPESSLRVLPASMEEAYEAETQPLEEDSPSMLCAGRIAGFAQTVIGAKRIRSAATLGLVLQTVAVALGLLYVLVFVLMGAYKDISGGVLLLYQAICAVVTVFAVRLLDK